MMEMEKDDNAMELQNESEKMDDHSDEDDAMNTDAEMNEMTDDSSSTSRYIDYSPEAYANAEGKKRVLFFHAKWCPTCKAANIEFMNNLNSIPEDVVVLKTDYDTESALKSQYGITYQHTFVYVDAQGNEIKKWNGGGITDLTAYTT